MTSRTTQGLTQFLRNFWGKDLAPASPPRSDSTLERRMKIHVMITHFKICCKKDVCPRRMCLCSSGCLQCRHITGSKRYSINHFLIMGGSMVREKQWWDWMIFWGLKTFRIWQVRITMHLGLVGQLFASCEDFLYWLVWKQKPPMLLKTQMNFLKVWDSFCNYRAVVVLLAEHLQIWIRMWSCCLQLYTTRDLSCIK